MHPEWDEGHHQLNYSQLESCDHLKPDTWKGDIQAGTCSPAVAWYEGQKLVEVILHEHHVVVDFTETFSHPDVDTLWPLPGGNYPGISTELDCSIELSTTSADATINAAKDDDNEEDLDI